MVAEMADLEADDALVGQSFLDACTFEQSSELVVQESMPDRHVEWSCSRDAQQCESSTRQMAVTDDSVIQTFLDMLDKEHVDASSLDGQEMHVANTPCQSEMPSVDACSVELARLTRYLSSCSSSNRNAGLPMDVEIDTDPFALIKQISAPVGFRLSVLLCLLAIQFTAITCSASFYNLTPSSQVDMCLE
ncbi:hypothetical protein L7F22_049704 [Adiantum nelumboides]|nr:hypothetical protein [Adiantum nelumboides]